MTVRVQEHHPRSSREVCLFAPSLSCILPSGAVWNVVWIGTGYRVRGIDYDRTAFHETFFYNQTDRLVYKHIKQIHICETHPLELARGTRVYHVIFRHRSLKVFIRQVMLGLPYNIYIRKCVDGLQKEIFEHPYRIFRHSTIV